MSKNGRYSSNRIKTEALSSNKTIEVSDCGTMFLLTETAGFNSITLPKVADAGPGWWCRFVVAAMAGGGVDVDIAIAQSTDDSNNIVKVRALDGTGGAVTQTAACDGITFIGDTAVAGDQAELWTDGENWYGLTICSASGGITKHDA